MKALVIALAALLCPSLAVCAPSRAVACHDLKGASIEYGVPEKVRIAHFGESVSSAGSNHTQEFQYVPPYPNGFPSAINFLIDPDKPSMTVMWQLPPALQDANRTAAPSEPHDDTPSPVSARIVSYHPDELISAVDSSDGAEGHTVTTYTLLPKLYSVLITQTSYTSGREPGVVVTTVRGACDF